MSSVPRYNHVARKLALVILCLGCTVLAAHVVLPGRSSLRWLPSVAMGLSFVLLGVAFQGTGEGLSRERWLIPALAVGALGLSRLAFGLLGIDFGPSNQFWMAANSALLLFVTTVALGLIALDSDRWMAVGQTLAVLAALGALLVLAGHVFGVIGLYRVGPDQAASIPGTLGILLFSMALLFARPNRGIMAALTRDDPGGVLLRAGMLPLLALPFAIVWAAHLGRIAGLYDEAMGDALLGVALVAILGIFLWRLANHLSALQRVQEQWVRAYAESEEVFGLLVHSVQEYGLFLLTPDGKVASWNTGAERIKGYAAQEIIGQPYERFFLQEDLVQGLPRRLLEQARREGHVVSEGWRRRKDGTRFFARTELTSLRRADGSLRGYAKVTQDVTGPRLAAEQAARLQSIVDTATDAIMVIDEQGDLETFNLAAEHIFGYSQAEILGKNVALLMPSPYRERHDQYIADYLRTGVARIIGIGREIVAQRKDRTQFPMELAVSEIQINGHRKFTGIVRDITARKESERALRDSEARFRTLCTQAPVAIWHTDTAGNITYASPRWQEMSGQPCAEACGRGWLAALHGEDRATTEATWAAVHASRSRWTHEFRLGGTDDDIRWVRALGEPIFGEAGGYQGYVGTVEDITERKEHERRVREAALHDPVTDLPNRMLAVERVAAAISAARKQEGNGALLLLDLDRFRIFNETYGMAAGNQVLRETARRLKNVLGPDGWVARMGGDQFLLLSPTIAEPEKAVVLAERAIRAVGAPFRSGPYDLSVSASAGACVFPDMAGELDTVLQAAELALADAKKGGRGQVQAYRAEFGERAADLRQLEHRLQEAIDGEEFALFYQPVVDTGTGAVVAVEALLRWPQQGGDSVGPARFIPIAETTGLIIDLGRWVIGEACRQHQAWLDQGLPPIPIAVNVSAVQFRQRNFAQQFLTAVNDCGGNPDSLQVEVTESAVMEDVEDAARVLERLRREGFKVSLDDFGTGHSSLSYLRKLPIDKIKVDQSFVRGIERDETGKAIAEAIVELGRTLDLEVVAEGIENGEALAVVQAFRCQQAQGYHFCVPVSGSEFARWYARWSRVA